MGQVTPTSHYCRKVYILWSRVLLGVHGHHAIFYTSDRLRSIDYLDPSLPLWEDVHDLYSAGLPQEICHAGHTAPTRQHELDHTDQESICPERSRSWNGNRRSVRGVKYKKSKITGGDRGFKQWCHQSVKYFDVESGILPFCTRIKTDSCFT